MHISDGILNGQICAAGYAVSGVITAFSLKRMETDTVPRAALVTAAFFVGSLVHVRIGPTSVHLVLNGLAGILLGTAAFPAILVGLLFQAVLLGHGGLTSLGVNAICMGVPALAASGLFGAWNALFGRKYLRIAGFVCGSIPILLGITLVAAALALSDKTLIPFAEVAVSLHVPLILIEGVMCAFVVGFLNKVKPSLLYPKR